MQVEEDFFLNSPNLSMDHMTETAAKFKEMAMRAGATFDE